MSEIAKQSFDEMEAYLLLKEKTEEKQHEVFEKYQTAYRDFAARNNVELIQSDKNELFEKMVQATHINHYYNDVFIIFFKTNWQDDQINDAIEAKNLNNLEQSRNSMISFALEGQKVLDTLKSFQGDPSLTTACKQALAFYKKEAETLLPVIIDFNLRQEQFEKMKSAFEKKSTHTKEETDAYNKAVKDINAILDKYNKAINDLNQGRTEVINNWDRTTDIFFDTHMPYYRK